MLIPNYEENIGQIHSEARSTKWSEHIRKVNVIKGKKTKSAGAALDIKGN